VSKEYRKGSPVIDYSYDDDIECNDDMDKTALGDMKRIFHSMANSGRPIRGRDKNNAKK